MRTLSFEFYPRSSAQCTVQSALTLQGCFAQGNSSPGARLVPRFQLPAASRMKGKPLEQRGEEGRGHPESEWEVSDHEATVDHTSNQGAPEDGGLPSDQSVQASSHSIQAASQSIQASSQPHQATESSPTTSQESSFGPARHSAGSASSIWMRSPNLVGARRSSGCTSELMYLPPRVSMPYFLSECSCLCGCGNVHLAARRMRACLVCNHTVCSQTCLWPTPPDICRPCKMLIMCDSIENVRIPDDDERRHLPCRMFCESSSDSSSSASPSSTGGAEGSGGEDPATGPPEADAPLADPSAADDRRFSFLFLLRLFLLLLVLGPGGGPA